MIRKILPWRYQSKTNFLNQHSNFFFRKVLKTKPIACSPNSETQYISLVCHRDLCICILAIKSFLRFYNKIQVIIQDDGSLTKNDTSNLKKHIPNIKIINRSEADARVNSKINKELATSREADVSFLKLIDVNILFEKRIIVADSDILFLRRPDEIIDWIESKNPQPFYHHVPNANKSFEKHITIINEQLNTKLTKLDYCSGLIGITQPIPIEDIENTTNIISNISQVWGLEQNIYAFLLKEKSIKLNKKFYTAIFEEANQALLDHAKMLHFSGKLKHKNYLKQGNIIINQIKKNHA